jgi:hypothetical protein
MPSGLQAAHPACRVDGESETVAHCSTALCTPSASAMAKCGSVSTRALLKLYERRESQATRVTSDEKENVPRLLSSYVTDRH